MTQAQHTVLKLVQVAVGGKDVEFPADCDWPDVKNIAIRQGVLGLCVDAFDRLPKTQRPGLEILMPWLGHVVFMESVYAEHKRSIGELADFYARNNIKMLLLKGYGLSKFWPNPARRPVGDVDTYNFGKHKLADRLVREKFNVRIDNSHHKHSVFPFKKVTVENHFSFLNTYGHRSTARIESILHSVIEETKDNEIANLYYPSARFNSLYLLRHNGEHFASVDMSLRQVLDWGFFVRANHVDWDWLLSTLEKVGMKEYLAVLNAICYRYLGFEVSLFPHLPVDDTLVERSLYDILQPEVEPEHHKNTFREILFRFRRWWRNGWKHDIVFRESRWQSLLTQTWGHLLKPAL